MKHVVGGAEADRQQIRRVVAAQSIGFERGDRELHEDLIQIRGGQQGLIGFWTGRGEAARQRMWKGSSQTHSVDRELTQVLSDVLGSRPDRSPALSEVARREVSIVETLDPSGQLLDVERAAVEAAPPVAEPPGLPKTASHR